MKRILVVDDDPSIVNKLAVLLADRYHVDVASNGFEALKRVDAGPYDLMLLDLKMPGLDGPGLVHELRARRAGFPVILLSAAANLSAQAQALGVKDYLAKPFDVDRLEALIARRLEG